MIGTDPIILAIGFGPLAVYLIALGVLNLTPRPMMTTGGRDMAALAVGLAGLMMIGPCNLFLPAPAAQKFGANVWFLMAALYAFLFTLVVLYQRPRLVFYNLPIDELRQLLKTTTGSLDPHVRWAGDYVALPTLELEVQLESFAVLGSATVTAASQPLNFEAWRQLESGLKQQLGRVRVPPHPCGASLLVVGLAILAISAWHLRQDPGSIVSDLSELLRLQQPRS